MLEKVRCNLCGADHYATLYRFSRPGGDKKKSDYLISESVLHPPERIVRCRRCGLIYVNPRPNGRELLRSYARMVDEEYTREEIGRRSSARIILDRLKRLRKRGRLLDIGCASGFLLDEARKSGWETDGVEISRWAAAYAREKFGLRVFVGKLRKANFPDHFFDAVIMKDTIEHLTNPRDTLIEIRRILKPDGVLCINTPDVGSFWSKILKAKWWGINQSHLFYFSRRSLYRLLEATGFSVLATRSHARVFTLDYWAYRIRPYNRFLYGMFKFLAGIGRLQDRPIRISTADQIEIYARRSRKLKYIPELEREVVREEKGKKEKIIVVLPAHDAARTLGITVRDIPRDVADEIILVDDASTDNTVEIARKLNLKVFVQPRRSGYGANQKTCYRRALEAGADIVVMVHPDYQYDPRVIPEMVAPIREGRADAVLGSRMMKGGALEGGMPRWKHDANILLTAIANVGLGTYLTEYHSGFRAYSRRLLETVRFEDNSDGVIFDTEIIVQAWVHFFKIEEVPIRTRYFDETSVIKFWASVGYGLNMLKTLLKYLLHTHRIWKFRQFE